MSVGIPNFIGERLKEAREARGLTMSGLAELAEISRASISMYEQGNTFPRIEVCFRLSEILKVPTDFFLREGSTSTSDTLFYRSLTSATKVDRSRAERKYRWLKHINSYLRRFVRLPEPKVPQFDIPSELSEIDPHVIAEVASSTREHWGLGSGPISDVMLLLENNGVVISKSTFDTKRMDGYSGTDGYSQTPFVIIAYDKGSAVRSRYDLAHELGHLILHQHLPANLSGNPTNTRILERQAHRFAGAFLLPEESFAKDFQSAHLDALKGMKGKWLVSISAMLHRISDLGWVSEEESKKLWINYSRRKWRTSEPLDDLLAMERPRLLRRAFELIVKEGIREPGQIIHELCLSPSDICELACLDLPFFSSDVDYLLHSSISDYARDISNTSNYVIHPHSPRNLN